MNSDTSWSIPAAWLHALTIFLSAFLLFLVQPLISKAILPWFGGSTGVWTTCLLFFQVMLVAGYAYAHYLAGISAAAAWRLHSSLLLVALVLVPITPRDVWKPEAGAQPLGGITLLLLCHVGLQYFLLASTGPLVQAWFARGFPDRSPYRLYALSNVGSLGALLCYPFVVEPQLPLLWQGWIWSALFAVFALLSVRLAYGYRFTAPQAAPAPEAGAGSASSFDAFLWLILPAFASALLLIVTDHLCRDVAVSPFLWIVPLALYLLTFIICFEHARWYKRGVWSTLTLALLVALALLISYADIDQLLLQRGYSWGLERAWDAALGANETAWSLEALAKNLFVEAAIYLSILFSVCMVCHGELVRRKPPPALLTRFYLMIAVGGALGGASVALIAPVVFRTHFEWSIALVTAAALSGSALWLGLRRRRWFWQAPAVAASAAVVALMVWVVWPTNGEAVMRSRNFYGILKVTERHKGRPEHGYSLVNGRILHGYQYLAPERRREPSTYYLNNSGVGIAVRNFPRHGRGLRIGVVGLGAGTMAVFAQPEDQLTFYDINPAVVDVARRYFSYLSDCPCEVSVQLGDARISLERELLHHQPRMFDVLVLDAFSGDAIPIHLLTEEAFAMYWRHMHPDGVIVVHTSNLYLNLLPVVRGLANRQQREAIVINHDGSGQDDAYTSASEWVLVTNNAELLQCPDVQAHGKPVAGDRVVRWTDQYSSLLQVLN